jgi:FAD/FMN-containing dehydrogenase
MDEIIEVHEKSAYAVVEPGVTFLQLYEYCRERELAVWPSVPAIAWGSVVGNVRTPPPYLLSIHLFIQSFLH